MKEKSQAKDPNWGGATMRPLQDDIIIVAQRWRTVAQQWCKSGAIWWRLFSILFFFSLPFPIMVLVRSHCNGGEKACRDWGGGKVIRPRTEASFPLPFSCCCCCCCWGCFSFFSFCCCCCCGFLSAVSAEDPSMVARWFSGNGPVTKCDIHRRERRKRERRRRKSQEQGEKMGEMMKENNVISTSVQRDVIE